MSEPTKCECCDGHRYIYNVTIDFEDPCAESTIPCSACNPESPYYEAPEANEAAPVPEQVAPGGVEEG